jgi:hypothetical protein
MLSPAERAALKQEWLADIEAEIERRRAAKVDESGDDPRQWFMNKLKEMGSRMRAAPDYVEPTAAEKAESAAFLDKWFDEHYGRR